MLRNRILTLTAALAAVALATATTNDSVTLKRAPKVGDTADYTVEVEVEIEGMGEFDVSMDVTDEVVKVADDGTITVKSYSTNQVLMSGGAVMQEMPDEVSTTIFAANGLIMKIEASEMSDDTYRFGSLMNFMWPTKPVDVGSEWKIETKANSDQNTFDMTYEYKIVERGELLGHDCFKIEFETEESSDGGASSEGTIWIDVKTGLTVKADAEMYGAPMMGMAVDMHFVLELDD